MEKICKFYIFINNIPLEDSPFYIRILLKDMEGRIHKKIEEKALISDKNFRDLYALYIGLKEALKLKYKRILVMTNNVLLGTIIKSGFKKGYRDDYGLYPNIKELINNFKDIGVRVVP